jgi:hypothetical protein
MPRPASEEIRRQWKESILRQRESGLSVLSWCQQNKINIQTFRYWQSKFFPKAPLKRSDFKEIPNQHNHDVADQGTGVSLSYQGVSIHIEKKFDPCALKQCLEVLREILC